MLLDKTDHNIISFFGRFLGVDEESKILWGVVYGLKGLMNPTLSRSICEYK